MRRKSLQPFRSVLLRTNSLCPLLKCSCPFPGCVERIDSLGPWQHYIHHIVCLKIPPIPSHPFPPRYPTPKTSPLSIAHLSPPPSPAPSSRQESSWKFLGGQMRGWAVVEVGGGVYGRWRRRCLCLQRLWSRCDSSGGGGDCVHC